MVASRLSTAVISEASANTAVSRRLGLPFAHSAIHAPQARNSPSTSQKWASTRTAARNPTTGPSCSASARAWSSEIAPVATAIPAAGTAITASGHPKGRTTAQTRTATSRTTERVSARGVFRGRSSRTLSVVHAHETRPDHELRGQAPVPALNTDSRTEDALPDTGTVPFVHFTFSGSFSSGGVTTSVAGVAVFAPLISGLENDSPAQALWPGFSVMVVTVVPVSRCGSGPSCCPDALANAAPG